MEVKAAIHASAWERNRRRSISSHSSVAKELPQSASS